MLRKRAQIINSLREFFNGKGYLEVETPILSPNLIPEAHLEVFRTEFIDLNNKSQELYLIPSPEIWMKKLLGGGTGNIFQITKSFRNCEAIGRFHNPEFTMLEWYTVEADYIKSIEITEELFSHLSSHLSSNPLAPPFLRISMEEAFGENTGLELARLQETGEINEAAHAMGIGVTAQDTWESIFNKIFLTFVEPELPADRPLILYNYPAQIRCLAKTIPGSPWCERWELYAAGIELANCFTEETDKKRILDFFQEESGKKDQAIIHHRADVDFLEIYSSNFPACSGVALGIDRLMMIVFKADTIEEVIPFPFSRMYSKGG
ncbi:MAG: elongation factor P--(R)-beta-lysine ligase [Spirochaetota bacterium]